MDAPHELPAWMTVAQVAEHLQVGEETVRRWIKRGDLPALDLGGRKGGYRIRSADLEDFIAARFSGPGKELAA